MAYRIVRVITCDTPGCITPSPYVLQGEDDTALKDGWLESRDGVKPPTHVCPECARRRNSPPPVHTTSGMS